MSLLKLVERKSALVLEKADLGLSHSGAPQTPEAKGVDGQGKSFRDYVKSSARPGGAQRLEDIALTESYGSALAAQILAERSRNVALAQSEVNRRQSAFDRDLKQLLAENDLDATNPPKLEIDGHGRILAPGVKDARKLEALLNHTPGVAEALDTLATAKIVLEQMQRQAEVDANRGPRFTVSFDGTRARLATQKKVAELGQPPEPVSAPNKRSDAPAD